MELFTIVTPLKGVTFSSKLDSRVKRQQVIELLEEGDNLTLIQYKYHSKPVYMATFSYRKQDDAIIKEIDIGIIPSEYTPILSQLNEKCLIKAKVSRTYPIKKDMKGVEISIDFYIEYE